MTTKKVVLRSTHPEEYPDLVIECRVLKNGEIGGYLSTIPAEKKTKAYKSVPVSARQGVEGEEVKSVLTTIYEGREYILGEESGVVKKRDGELDIVVTNTNSTANESYIVKACRFASTYEQIPGTSTYRPVRDEREITEVPENVIIETLWGSEAICLKGGYIVTYDAASCDYNTLERGAFKSTYTREHQKTKKK